MPPLGEETDDSGIRGLLVGLYRHGPALLGGAARSAAVAINRSSRRARRKLSGGRAPCRGRVIAKRTRAKNSLRTLLRCAGVVPPSRPALWTKKGLEWLRRLELPTASHRLRRDLLLEEVEALSRQAERIEMHLNQQAKLSPAVLLLRSIPGVGVRTAEAVAAFIDDPDRFRDAGPSRGVAPGRHPVGMSSASCRSQR